MKINHIGYLVKDIDKAIEQHRMLGYFLDRDVVCDEARGVKLGFMSKEGYTLEFVEPISESSVAWNLFKRKGAGPYHICYEIDKIGDIEEELVSRGFVLINPPAPALAFGGRRVAFYTHREIGTIELLETGGDNE